MNRLFERFGKLITASFVVMTIGIVLFLLTPLFYGYLGLDTDIFGLIIFGIGLVICIIGIIRRYKPHGFKLIGLVILAIVFGLPMVSLIISLINYLVTGKPLGEQ